MHEHFCYYYKYCSFYPDFVGICFKLVLMWKVSRYFRRNRRTKTFASIKNLMFVGTVANAVFLGSLGMLAAVLGGKAILAYMIPMIYDIVVIS